MALARLFSERNVLPLPSAMSMRKWEAERARWAAETGHKFHDVESQPGPLGSESFVWLGFLYRFAGLGTLKGDGRVPPVLSQEVLDALKTIHKYPSAEEEDGKAATEEDGGPGVEVSRDEWKKRDESDWVLVIR